MSSLIRHTSNTPSTVGFDFIVQFISCWLTAVFSKRVTMTIFRQTSPSFHRGVKLFLPRIIWEELAISYNPDRFPRFNYIPILKVNVLMCVGLRCLLHSVHPTAVLCHWSQADVYIKNCCCPSYYQNSCMWTSRSGHLQQFAVWKVFERFGAIMWQEDKLL